MEIRGKVVKGDGYGRTLGFPTANIYNKEFTKENQEIRHGIYAGFVIIEKTNTPYRAGIVIGPLDKDGIPKLEAHLLDFDGDLYGEMLTFNLIKYLRPFKKYESESELKESIAGDIKTIIRLALPEL